MKVNKYKNEIKNKKNPGKKLYAIPRFPAGSFAVHIADHFSVRDHLRSSLGIISGLGIICGRGSFAALYRTATSVLESREEFSAIFHSSCCTLQREGTADVMVT